MDCVRLTCAMDDSLVDRASAIAATNGWQMSAREYRGIIETVVARSPCHLLVFGAGHDSTLWLDANPGGTTWFLEDSKEWIAFLEDQSHQPPPVIRPCHYAARPLQWVALARPAWLRDGMPSGTEAVPWDVIVVDAPRGYRPWHPGRLQAISWAAHLATVGDRVGARDRSVDVFVHDFDRRTERVACRIFLGNGTLVSVTDRLAHFRIPSQPHHEGGRPG